ncbi:TPA: hypothetical protein QCW90_003256 [Bacillus mobilis]|nr:hypothetical protein [Bacillus mobilis]
MKQLTLEDVVGSFDYKATSTSKQFLCDSSHSAITPTFEVHFFDQDEKQKIDWFEVKSEEDGKNEAIAKHGRIQIIKVVESNRSLAEIMELD